MLLGKAQQEQACVRVMEGAPLLRGAPQVLYVDLSMMLLVHATRTREHQRQQLLQQQQQQQQAQQQQQHQQQQQLQTAAANKPG